MREAVSVLIPAAGSGERLGRGPKALLVLHGRPVIDWIADKARRVGGEVLVACAPGMEAPAGCIKVAGGATRQESVQLLAQRASGPWTLLWDAASPFASLALAQRVLDAAVQHGCASAVLPASVPWVEVDGDLVLRAHPAAGTGSSQTPQAYRTDWLRAAVDRAAREGWVAQSTVQLMLRAGHAVRAVPSEKLNLKLTTPEDWQLAQALFAQLQS